MRRSDDPSLTPAGALVVGLTTTRGYSDTAVALPGLWADYDVFHPAHKETRLPPTQEVARSLIAEFALPPTLVIDTGHGLQPWWLFRELWVFDTAAERQAAQTLARRFLATLQEKARAHGWMIDPTSDLVRVLRLPGTWNRKLQPVPVRVIEYNAASRYNVSDFAEYLIDAPQTAHLPRQAWYGASGTVAPVLRYC